MTLIAPQNIGLCDALVLDATSSTGTQYFACFQTHFLCVFTSCILRQLCSFSNCSGNFGVPFVATWSLVGPASLPTSAANALVAMLAAASSSSSPLLVSIPSNLLQFFDAPFEFSLNLTNTFGRSAIVRASVLNHALTTLPIFLSGPAFQSLTGGQAFQMQASTDYSLAGASVCGATVKSMSVAFAWTQTLGSSVDLSIGGVAVAAADVASLPPAVNVDLGRTMLFLPAQSLRAGKTYGNLTYGNFCQFLKFLHSVFEIESFQYSFSECRSFHGDYGRDSRARPCFDASKACVYCHDRCQRGRLAAGGSDFGRRPVVLVRSGKHMSCIDPKHITYFVCTEYTVACVIVAGQAHMLLPSRWSRAVPLTRMWHPHCRPPLRSRTRGRVRRSPPRRIKPARPPSLWR